MNLQLWSMIPVSFLYKLIKKLKISKYIDLNNTINQLDLTEMYELFHSTRAEYKFFLSSI